MKNFIKIGTTDITQLALELHQNPGLWNTYKERLMPGSPHEHSDDIWVRMNDRTGYGKAKQWKDFNKEHESIWYPGYYALPAVRKIVFDLARFVEAERIGDIMIWRVKPGDMIKPHADDSWHVHYYDKFNVCVQAQEGCSFNWEREAMLERAGEIHRFTNTTQHAVLNESVDDYIVMVVCLRVHDFARRFRG